MATTGTPAGAFSDAREIIAKAFDVTPKGKGLRQLCAQLDRAAAPVANYPSLVADLYASIEGKCGRRSRSTENWRWEPQVRVAAHNGSKEVLLERAIANLAKAKHLSEWSNQIPAISGLVATLEERRAAVDLAKLSNGTLELIELKWDSDTPTYAAFEIVLYGLAYTFCRVHALGGDSNVMQAKRVNLRVLAPESFYRGRDYRNLEAGLSQGFNAVLRKQLSRTLSGDFRFLKFPAGFKQPFRDGAAVKTACCATMLGPVAAAYCNIIRNRLHPVYP